MLFWVDAESGSNGRLDAYTVSGHDAGSSYQQQGPPHTHTMLGILSIPYSLSEGGVHIQATHNIYRHHMYIKYMITSPKYVTLFTDNMSVDLGCRQTNLNKQDDSQIMDYTQPMSKLLDSNLPPVNSSATHFFFICYK